MWHWLYQNAPRYLLAQWLDQASWSLSKVENLDPLWPLRASPTETQHCSVTVHTHCYIRHTHSQDLDPGAETWSGLWRRGGSSREFHLSLCDGCLSTSKDSQCWKNKHTSLFSFNISCLQKPVTTFPGFWLASKATRFAARRSSGLDNLICIFIWTTTFFKTQILKILQVSKDR